MPYKPNRTAIVDRGFETLCIVWLLAKDKDGYGSVRVGLRKDGSRRQMRAHRLAWEMAHGPIPKGMKINHKFRQRDCVNEDHLELVTATGNIRRDHAGTKLTMEVAEQIRQSTGSTRQIADRFGLQYELIRRVRNGERWNPEKAEVL